MHVSFHDTDQIKPFNQSNTHIEVANLPSLSNLRDSSLTNRSNSSEKKSNSPKNNFSDKNKLQKIGRRLNIEDFSRK